jgi:S-adenosylhomocysteine hydrolase
MNERIKQLAEQANVLHADFFDNELEVEKFAELIVEECAKRAEVYAYMSPNFNALAEELRSMIGVAQ